MLARGRIGRLISFALVAMSTTFTSKSTLGAWPDPPRRRARWEAPEQKPLPLRLDEVPELRLLAPFRDPKGPPATSYATYRSGPWADWRKKLWFPLDQAPKADEASARPNDAISLDTRLEGHGLLHEHPWLARRSEQSVSFPFAADGSGTHFFARHAYRSRLPIAVEEFSIDERWLPQWLRRLDPTLAESLIEEVGCGRGGRCSPSVAFPGAAFVELWNALAPTAQSTRGAKCRERKVTLRRYGSEHDSLVLIDCDDALSDGALETVSVLARPPEVPFPGPLPDEPDPNAPPGEWVEGVRLLDPRLVWVLGKVGRIFPGRPIYIYSGYRPAPKADGDDRARRKRSHRSLHASGRALDIAVEGVSNEELLAWCFRLVDTGCGYYPNSRFVHVDVRPRSSGNAVWVDASTPGSESNYVSEWAGVVEGGRVVWSKPAWSDPYDSEYLP